MSWQKFNASKKEYPESVIEKKIEGFENATDSLASLSLVELKSVQFISARPEGDFKFSLYLHSNIIKGYKLEVITIGYDVKLSPINFKIEDSIDEEVYGDGLQSFYARTVNSSNELEEVMDKIFQSKSFNNVVRGIIKIAQKRIK